ncbi:ArsR family transcriptional regulator [Klebsiella aerogenes]
MTDIINGDIYRYFSIEEALFEASHITNLKTGERVELSNDAKVLYSRMRKRYHFFTTSSTGGNKGAYYDNIEELKDSANLSKSTTLRCLKVLKQVGLVVATLSGRSNQWTVANITPDSFLLERNAGTSKNPVWVDCLKHPVFGNAKEDVAPEVQREKAKADPMCDLDEAPEEEAPAPEKVKPTPKPKLEIKKSVTPPAARSDDKEYSAKLRQFESAGHWYQFSEYQLPDLERFKRDGKLTNEYALAYLDKHRPQQTMNTH